MTDDARKIPVIVGVGQVNDRPEDPQDGLDSLGLMEAALRVADRDAGGGWLPQLNSLAVVAQISFPKLGNMSGPLAEKLGAKPRICTITRSATGDSPILLLNEAANRIAAGEIEVAAVVGGEALRTAAKQAAAAAGNDESAHNAARAAASKRAPEYRQRYGVVAAVDIYPLFENAGRAAYGQTLDEAQQESAEIWSRFSQVAAANPGAWIRKPVSADVIKTPSADNRPISFPYNKLMVANSSVNQGAGFIVTSLAKARAAGVPEDKIVYIGKGAAAHEPEDILARDSYARTASMAVVLQRVLELNAIKTSDIDCIELYSCFPCVPKMARRVIDWPLEKPASVFGGLTFGGGPIGNYMSHAVVSMVEKLRKEGKIGLLFANGGVATHNHAIMLTRNPVPAGTFPQNFDYQAEADSKRGPVPPLAPDYKGPGSVETYTVLYNRDGTPRMGSIIARAPTGERFLAKIPAEDAVGIAFLIDGKVQPVGTKGEGVVGPDGDLVWRTSTERVQK